MAMFRTKSAAQIAAGADEPGRRLRRTLTAWDLTIMGVAVAVGAGIFSTGARAAANFSGPAVSLSFVIAGVVCALAIMCYAEFATRLPVAGSAYIYTYASLGEAFAWFVGWNLILELFTAAAVIAKYWGIYLSEVFAIAGVDLPPSFMIGGLEVVWGPVIVVAVFTTLLVLGTKLSAVVSNVFTLIKIGVVLVVIVAGFVYFKADNFSPFIPPAQPTPPSEAAALQQSLFGFLTGAEPATYGILGVMAGASVVFFAFIGFDVVATTAEEVKNPKRTLPRGIFAGLGITTLLYVLVGLALTGMVSYTQLAAVEAPTLTTAFQIVGNDWIAAVIAVGSLLGLTTVVMVLLLGISRVVLAMSRDGLFPRALSKTSEKRATPVRLQVGVGVLVAIVAGTTNVDLLEEMINIGTLFAFICVALGLLVFRKIAGPSASSFTVPGGPVIPIVSAAASLYLATNLKVETWIFFAIWVALGFVIYFLYGFRKSRLARGDAATEPESPAEPKDAEAR